MKQTDDITYDDKGRIKEIKENNQQTRSYTYNTLGYLTKEKDETNEILYTYDNEANITRKQVYNLNNE